jgi:hypothetical protein
MGWHRTVILTISASTLMATIPSYWLRWALTNFLPVWPRMEIFPISASQVVRITGVSHQCLAWWALLINMHCSIMERHYVCFHFSFFFFNSYPVGFSSSQSCFYFYIFPETLKLGRSL